MTARAERITIAGICGAIAFAASQVDTIFTQIEKHWSASPFFALAESLRYEAAALIICTILLYKLDAFNSRAYFTGIRGNWKSARTSLFGLSLHTEEWAVSAAVLVLVMSFFTHSIVKASNTYRTYGLNYIAKNICDGSVKEALDRMSSIKTHLLWRKYRSMLQGGIERHTYLEKVADKRAARFYAEKDRNSDEENIAQAVELRLIFGIDVRQAIQNELAKVSTNPALQSLRVFLSNSHC